ncbi:DUF4350 domain-containing protein [Belliella pelovolcani]|uniref:DUF4350 domain-containing protein n=1 Tax=Belliella pelovolcani TaxID=529505 RepID=UPI00391A5175
MRQGKQKFLIGFLVFTILVILILQATSKPPLNWEESYDKMDKAPYGGKIFYEQFAKVISPESLAEINSSTYEWLRSDAENGTLLIFNSGFFPDKETSKRLLAWVNEGNAAFISARFIGKELLDSLGIDIKSTIELSNFQEHISLYLNDTNLSKGQEFMFDRSTRLTYFTFPDSLDLRVLGMSKFTNSEKAAQPMFLEVGYGEGKFFLHLFPLAFSNYFLLDAENKIYTESILGYLPIEQLVFYDNYVKNGKSIFSSPLYLFLSNPNLKMAYYAIIAMLLLWIVFEGRRKQRSIPIVKPLENQTVAFAETISAMYLEKNAYRENIEQQIALFMDYCRTSFRLGLESVEDDLRKLAARSSYPLEKTKDLFAYIEILRHKQECTSADVIALNKIINEFKKYQHGGK